MGPSERLGLSLSFLLICFSHVGLCHQLPRLSPYEPLDLALLVLKFNYIYSTQNGSFVFHFFRFQNVEINVMIPCINTINVVINRH